MGPINRAALASQLSQIYGKFGNFTKAVELAFIALDIWNETYCYTGKSDAAFALALTYVDCSKVPGIGTQQELEWLRKARSVLEEWADRDHKAVYKDGEQQKCFRLAEIEDCFALFYKLAGAESRAAHWANRGNSISGIVPSTPVLNSIV